MNILHKLRTYIIEKRRDEKNRLYYEDTREIQYAINRPLTARELSIIFQMSDEQIYMIKNWLKEGKNNESN